MAFTQEQNLYIIEKLYQETKGKVNLGMKLFYERYNETIAGNTLRAKWNGAGLKIGTHGGHRHGIPKTSIIKTHSECNGDLEKMIDQIGEIKERQLKRRCEEYGLKVH